MRVPGSSSGETPPHPVGYPVPFFEAGVQLYCLARWLYVAFLLARPARAAEITTTCPQNTHAQTRQNIHSTPFVVVSRKKIFGAPRLLLCPVHYERAVDIDKTAGCDLGW